MKVERYILLLVFLLPACASMTAGHYNTYQTAQTLPKGKTATGIGIGALSASLPMDGHVFLAFSPEGWLRYGVAERVEVGFRAYPFGISAEAKMLLIEGGPEKPSLALAPGCGYSRMESTGNEYYEMSWGILGSLPLIISIPIQGGNVVYFGPKFQYMFSADSSGYPKDMRTTFIGGFFGVAVKKGKVVYMPEISFFSYTIRYTYEYSWSGGRVEYTFKESGDILFPGLGISMAF